MSESIDQMISTIIQHESEKYTDIKGDAGGPTKYGISLRFVRGIPGPKFDLDGDGDTDARDIQLVDANVASSLFRQFFYTQPHINTLPADIQPMMFDEGVNFGAKHAIECMQRAIRCPADGSIGDGTRSVLNDTIKRIGLKATVGHIVDEFDARYRAIAAAKPGQRKFLNGWINRSESWRIK